MRKNAAASLEAPAGCAQRTSSRASKIIRARRRHAILANELTTHKSGYCCFSRSWPWALPDPKLLAVRAHEKIQTQLFAVYFRDMPELHQALHIDYDVAQYSWSDSDEEADDETKLASADLEMG